MSDRRPPGSNTRALDPGFVLKIARTARPSLPWTWEIISEDGKGGALRSMKAYQSAEDAWAAGWAALAEIGRLGDPAR